MATRGDRIRDRASLRSGSISISPTSRIGLSRMLRSARDAAAAVGGTPRYSKFPPSFWNLEETQPEPLPSGRSLPAAPEENIAPGSSLDSGAPNDIAGLLRGAGTKTHSKPRIGQLGQRFGRLGPVVAFEAMVRRREFSLVDACFGRCSLFDVCDETPTSGIRCRKPTRCAPGASLSAATTIGGVRRRRTDYPALLRDDLVAANSGYQVFKPALFWRVTA